MASERRLSAAAKRARQMLIGGLVLGHVAGVTVIGLALALGGTDAVISAAIGFACVLVFFAVGQAIELVACEMEPVQGMAVALGAYAVRVIGIGAGLGVIVNHPAMAPHVRPGWLMAAVTATVVAWIGGVVLVASRQRVPIYDADYVVPSAPGESD